MSSSSTLTQWQGSPELGTQGASWGFPGLLAVLGGQTGPGQAAWLPAAPRALTGNFLGLG